MPPTSVTQGKTPAKKGSSRAWESEAGKPKHLSPLNSTQKIHQAAITAPRLQRTMYNTKPGF